MLALYRSGRQSEALAAYHEARRALVEVGLSPSAELRQLDRRRRSGPERTRRPDSTRDTARRDRRLRRLALVAMEDDETLLRLDPETHQVKGTIGLGATPSAVTGAGGYVWVLCRQAETVVQVDAGTRTVVRTLALNGKITVPLTGFKFVTASTIAASPHAAWLAAGPGLVTRIDAAADILEHIGSGSASTVAVGDGAVWTVSGPPNVIGSGTTSRIDLRVRRVTEEVPSPNAARVNATFPVAADAAGVWVVDEDNTAMWKIDPAVAEISAVIPIRNGPIAIASGEGAVWTANRDGTVSRLDPSTAALARTIPLGRYPRIAYPVALAVGEGAVWVAVH
jgi:streptogramin lyase